MVVSATALPARFRLTDEGRRLIIRDVCKDCADDSTDLMVIQCNASNVHGYAFQDAYINVLSELSTVLHITRFPQHLLAFAAIFAAIIG